MRDLLNAFLTRYNKNLVPLIIWLVFIVFALIFLKSVKLTKKQLLYFSIVFLFGVVFSAFMGIAEERMHIFKFGVLGLLVSRDVGNRHGIYSFLIAALIGFSVSSFDETLQYFIPGRVADLRDVMFGIVGSLWGALLYGSLQFSNPSPDIEKLERI